MNTDLIALIQNYTIKEDKQINKICSPLMVNLGIPYFTYYFIEEDGRFGTLANNPEFMEYYYSSGMHLNNPYMSHPSLFRNGYIISPCTFTEHEQKNIKQKFQIDHLFLMLSKSEKRVEGFIFAAVGFDIKGIPHYIAHVDLLVKFSRYFKREASSLIGKLRADQFNMHQERQAAFLTVDHSLPLSNNNQGVQNFLKMIYGLSPQEERCHDLFKRGNSAQATAAIMGLSRRTVETYIEKIKDKLGCSSKWDLLEY